MGYTKAHVTQEYLQLIAEMVAKYKQRTYELMQIDSGDQVLDVGCGPGTDTLELGRLVGATGQVVGVDHAQNHLDLADEKALEAGLNWVKHEAADATSLPFEAGIFDASRSERLFLHLQQPELALAEMTRVTKPEGWVVVLDTDWSTLSIDTTEIDIEQRLKRYNAEHGTAQAL